MTDFVFRELLCYVEEPDLQLLQMVVISFFQQFLLMLNHSWEFGTTKPIPSLQFLAGQGRKPIWKTVGACPPFFLSCGWWILVRQEEIFGPVLSIMTYTTEDEAIQLANDTPYGLGGKHHSPPSPPWWFFSVPPLGVFLLSVGPCAQQLQLSSLLIQLPSPHWSHGLIVFFLGAVFSRDSDTANRIAKKLRCGIVWINCSQPTFIQLPWGTFQQKIHLSFLFPLCCRCRC